MRRPNNSAFQQPAASVQFAPDPAVDALWRESGELVRMLGASVATALRARSSH